MKKIPLTFILLLWCVLGYAQGSCVPTSSTINPTACGTYFAPSGQAYTSSGAYQDTIVNAGGCDSVITINLTIEQFSTGAAFLAVDNPITCVGGNDGAISATISRGGALLISEANLGNTDYIEITNVSNDSIDVTGYYVAASNSYTNINSVNTITWDLTGKIAGGDSDFREDATGPNYWGSNLFYNPGSAGWILLFDNNDNVIDAVFFEWSSADIINNFAPTIKGQVVTLGAEWIGNGVSGSGCTNSISRSTVNDTNTDIDWTCLPSNPGLNNISGTITTATILSSTWNTGDTTLSISNLVTGTYVLSSVDTFGCTYLDSLFLPDATPDTSTINVFTCGNYTSPAGNVYTMSGVYVDTIVSAAGCDSIITINLNTGATTPVNLTATACDTFRSPSGALYTMSGMYNDTIPSVGGCDSILIIDLTVNYSSYALISPTACGTYMAPSGRSYTTSGTYLDTIPNVIGCDSIITINLTIEQFSTGAVTLTVDNSISCPGGSDGAISAVINVPNPILISEVNLTAPDYIELTNAAASPVDVTGYYVATSNSYSNINTVNTRTWDLTGIMAAGAVDYREDASGGTNYWGNNLLYNPGSTGWVLLFDNNDNVIDAVFWGWTSADIANFAPTVKGNVVSLGAEWLGDGVDDNCNDALIRSLSTDNNNLSDWACLLDSKGGNNITGTITANNINSTTWNTGDTSLAISNLMAGTYVLTSVDSTLGCTYLDSITLVDGTIITTTVSATACDSYTSPAGMVYTMSGTYTDTVTSSAGCDSIIITNLTINNATTSSISPTACASYTSPSGMVYTMSGTYNDTIPNSIGCDSIITINLTISGATTATISPSACASYTSPSGMVYTMSGTYNDTIPNSIGCDSIITINLSINNSMATISPNSCGDYTSPSGMLYSMSGTYVDTIANSLGCDSIITINLTVTNIDTTVTLTGNVLSANATGASYQWIDCATNSPVVGATSANFTPPANGDYAVVLTQNGCTDTSSCINVTVIGLASLSDDNSIQLYPNPTQALVTIQLDLAYEQALVQVYNAAGQRVLQQTFDQQPQVTLNLKEQPAGSYWVSILINDQQKTFLVVKE